MVLITLIWADIRKTEEMSRAAALPSSDCAQCAKTDRRRFRGIKEVFMVIKMYLARITNI